MIFGAREICYGRNQLVSARAHKVRLQQLLDPAPDGYGVHLRAHNVNPLSVRAANFTSSENHKIHRVVDHLVQTTYEFIRLLNLIHQITYVVIAAFNLVIENPMNLYGFRSS